MASARSSREGTTLSKALRHWRVGCIVNNREIKMGKRSLMSRNKRGDKDGEIHYNAIEIEIEESMKRRDGFDYAKSMCCDAM